MQAQLKVALVLRLAAKAIGCRQGCENGTHDLHAQYYALTLRYDDSRFAPMENSSDFPLHRFKDHWSPFRLDALGLVTLLGADEVARAVGSLTRNTITDFLPILGAYKIAANQFTTTEPGFALYNVTDGIWVTELSGWWTRWLSTNLRQKHTILKVTVNEKARGLTFRAMVAFVIGFLVNAALVVLAVLQADWYGLANAAAVIAAIVVRNALLGVNRRMLDRAVEEEFVTPSPSNAGGQMAALIRLLSLGLINHDSPRIANKLDQKKKQIVRILIVTPEGKVAVIRTHRGLVRFMIHTPSVSNDKPSRLRGEAAGTNDGSRRAMKARIRQLLRDILPMKAWYMLARGVGWIAFAVHIIVIGQATLLTQIVTVAIMGIATTMAIFNVGVQNDHEVGDWLNISQAAMTSTGRRGAYARLLSLKVGAPQLSPDDELPTRTYEQQRELDIKMMQRWGLFPQKEVSEQWLMSFDKEQAEWERQVKIFDESESEWQRHVNSGHVDFQVKMEKEYLEVQPDCHQEPAQDSNRQPQSSK